MTTSDLEKQLLKLPLRDKLRIIGLLLKSLSRLWSASAEPEKPLQSEQLKLSQWPDAVLSYEGIPDFPAFESHRNDLLPPREPDLF